MPTRHVMCDVLAFFVRDAPHELREDLHALSRPMNAAQRLGWVGGNGKRHASAGRSKFVTCTNREKIRGQNGADMARKEISPPRCGMVVVSASYLPVWWWWLPRDPGGIRCVGSRLTQSCALCVIKDTRNTAGQFISVILGDLFSISYGVLAKTAKVPWSALAVSVLVLLGGIRMVARGTVDGLDPQPGHHRDYVFLCRLCRFLKARF